MKTIRIAFLAVLTVALSLPAFSSPFGEGREREARQLRGGGLGKAPRNATPVKPGGAQTKAAGGGWYICYSHPEYTHYCDENVDCRAECEEHCHGYCDWDYSES